MVKYLKERLFALILIVFMVYSCETIVNVSLPKHNPKIVVNSINNPHSPWVIDLSLSKGVFESGEIKMLSGAKVEIFENDISIADFKEIKDGLYISSNVAPKINVDYRLKISAEGFTPITAHCRIPKVVKIEAVSVKNVKNIDGDELELNIVFSDPPNIENFYSLSIIDRGYYVYFSSNDLLFRDEESSLEFSGRRFYGYRALFDDSNSYSLKLYITPDENVKVFEVDLSSLSKDYYRYLITREAQEETEDDPFVEPVMIFNNIKNGLGIFTGYNASKYNVSYNK